MQGELKARAFDVDDVRSLFYLPGAFAPEFVESRSTGFDVVGTLRLPGDRQPRVRLSVMPPDAPGVIVRTPENGLGAAPFMQWEGLADLGPGTTDRVREVLKLAVANDRELTRFRTLLTATDMASRRHEISMAGMDDPLPDALLAEAEAGPGERVVVVVYLRSACLQACAFCRPCRQPWALEHAERDLALVRDLARLVLRPARCRGANVSVRLEADDLARHPRLAEIVAAIHQDCVFPLSIMAPCNTLADPEAALRLAAMPSIDNIMMTLFGSSPKTHDPIAGRDGAFREVVLALRNLAGTRRLRLGVKALVTVPALSEIREMIMTARHFRADTTLVYPYDDDDIVKQNGVIVGNLALRPLIPRADAVKQVLAAEADLIRASGVTLVDFPDCAMPPALRDRLFIEHTGTMSRYPMLDICKGCARANRCARVPLAYEAVHGYAGLVPEPS